MLSNREATSINVDGLWKLCNNTCLRTKRKKNVGNLDVEIFSHHIVDLKSPKEEGSARLVALCYRGPGFMLVTSCIHDAKMRRSKEVQR